jgi:hypothetical protein
MVKIRFPLLMLATLVTGGCGGAKIPNQPASFRSNTVCENHAFSGVVLLAPENVKSAEKDFSPLWSPPSSLVEEATDKIPDYLRNVPAVNAGQAQELREIRERLPKTFCQTVGVTFEGKKAILLNCLASRNSYITNHWQQHFIKVYDGGSHFWNIVYLPENRSFTNLDINGIP